jgi:hypothetical protein
VVGRGAGAVIVASIVSATLDAFIVAYIVSAALW